MSGEAGLRRRGSAAGVEAGPWSSLAMPEHDPVLWERAVTSVLKTPSRGAARLCRRSRPAPRQEDVDAASLRRACRPRASEAA